DFLRDEVKPQVVCLPNAMFIGMARAFREALNVPVVCELTGEDIFLDAMKDQDREEVRRVIRARTADVARFVATSNYYADRMAEYLAVGRDQIDVVYTGIAEEYFSPAPARGRRERPPTVGYLARICSEKGLGRLVEAMEILVKLPGMSDVRVKVAGYLGGRDEKWFGALRKRIASSGLDSAFEYLGEVDRAAKLAMLDDIDVFSVPTAYPEAKGIYVLEALARGVPVVQPAHGSFPELIEQTSGGILVPPGDAMALAHALADLLRDPNRRQQLGEAGRSATHSLFTEDHMAKNMLKVFENVIAPNGGERLQPLSRLACPS
ncbi:MAG: mfpsA, partial [Phycisphaerales bacterium]|nr:mfpsA [Phycisphaerales bacterium]